LQILPKRRFEKRPRRAAPAL